MQRQPFAPRRVERLGRWQSGATPLKAYAILHGDVPALSPAIGQAARETVAAAHPAIAATACEGAGFVIIHHGEQAVWLLLHWWVECEICAELLWSANPAGTIHFTPVERPFMACIWELALIDHERQAYIRSLPAPLAASSYLDDLYLQETC